MGKIRKYGLIGYPLSYSFSPAYFAEKFRQLKIEDADYKAYPLEHISEVEKLIEDGISGFNVTIPYKQQIIPFLDGISDDAKAIGAVNTVKIENGKLIGFNTDVYGLENSLYNLLDGACVDNALILGTGGASKAAQYVLAKMGIDYQLVSRNEEYLTYGQLDRDIISSHKLLINTTPLGTSPDIMSCPNIPYQFLNDSHFVFDLIYNPEKSLFLTQAEKQGASILNGLPMLYDQAEKAWEIWNTDRINDRAKSSMA